MELRHLRYFIAVATELSFVRAAGRLRIAQPSLSAQIRKLEEELGFRLLDRSRSHVALTDAGSVFLEDARDVVARVEAAVKRARGATQGKAGELRIATISLFTHTFLPASLPHFTEAYPDVKVSISEMGPDNQAIRLAKGEIHLGFTAAPFPAIDKLERFHLHRLLRSPLVVLLNPRHPLAGGKSVSLRDLRKDTFIDFQMHRPHAYRLWAASICKQLKFKPEFGLAAENPENMIDMVAANQGIALVPKLTLRQLSGGVVVCPIAEKELEFELFAMWDPNFPSALLKNFLKIVLAEAETVQRTLYADLQTGGAVAGKRSKKRVPRRGEQRGPGRHSAARSAARSRKERNPVIREIL